MTRVKFYIEQDSQNEVFAYFPDLVWCDFTKTCYAHIGQHSACHPDYVKECKEANLLQSLDLFNELQSVGYRDLVII
jgi:hypothetical protein